MRNTNPKLKILYCILGPWKAKHLSLIRDTQQRVLFNNQIQQYLIDNHLDGLGMLYTLFTVYSYLFIFIDIDWNLRAQDLDSSADKDYLSPWLSVCLMRQKIFIFSN